MANENGAQNEDDIEGILVDEVIRATPLDDDSDVLLLLRSGQGIVGLVFSQQSARDAAEQLAIAAQEA